MQLYVQRLLWTIMSYIFIKWFHLFQFCTLLGACIVPFAFIIVWEMSRSLTAAALSASFILCGK